MRQIFTEWWNRPITRLDRFYGALVGAFGCFWVFVLGRMFLGPTPVDLLILAYWALAGVLAGALLGLLFPRAVTVVLYPFSLISFGGN